MIVLIGNNLTNDKDYSTIINSASLVIRMNKCSGYGKSYGTRSDIWSLVSDNPRATGMIMRKPHYEDVKKQVKRIWTVRPKGFSIKGNNEYINPIDDSQRIADIHNISNFEYYPKHLWDLVVNKLKEYPLRFVVPSTGILTLFRLMEEHKEPICIIGFTGRACSSHPMRSEVSVINKLENIGKVIRL